MPTALTHDGYRLHVEEAGQGSPVVFVHEFAGDHLSWEPQLRAFARRHRCVVYAARGYPPSDVPTDPAAYSQDNAVRDLASVLAARGIDPRPCRRPLRGASRPCISAWPIPNSCAR